MVARVLVNETGLFVSRPGIDVTTAGVSDFVFHSNRGKYFSPFMKGTIGPSSFVNIYDGADGTNNNRRRSIDEAYINYGRTFSIPPAVMTMFNGWAPYSDFVSPTYQYQIGESGIYIDIISQQSRLIIRSDRLRTEGTGFLDLPSATSYVVGRF